MHMSTAILDLAFSVIGCILALLLFHRVRQEQKRTRMLEHEYALRAIRDELFWLDMEARPELRSRACLSLEVVIDALIEAKDDLGLELYPLATILLDGEMLTVDPRDHRDCLDKGGEGLAEQELLLLGRLCKRVGREVLGMIKCNSALASLAGWTLLGPQTRNKGCNDARASRLHDVAEGLASLAQSVSATRPSTRLGAPPLVPTQGLSFR